MATPAPAPPPPPPSPDAAWRHACQVAGRLAEEGVQRLTLIGPGGRRVLEARTTDLPRVLLDAADGSRLLYEGGELLRQDGSWRPAAPDEAAYG